MTSHISTHYPHISQWRHNGRDGVPHHQPHDCLLNHLFRRRSKKTPVTGEFPAQRKNVSTRKNVSIWWRHHDVIKRGRLVSNVITDTVGYDSHISSSGFIWHFVPSSSHIIMRAFSEKKIICLICITISVQIRSKSECSTRPKVTFCHDSRWLANCL